MRTNEIKDLRLKSVEILKNELTKLKGEISGFSLEAMGGKLKNVAIIGQKRKDIARILTILSQMKRKEKV